MQGTPGRMGLAVRILLVGLFGPVLELLIPGRASAEGTLRLDELIAEALRNNPEIHMAEARTEAARHRVPQAESLQDPMVMFGYQNAGFDKFTYSQDNDSQLMFSASQMFPYPGKRGLKGEMARQEAASLGASAANARLTTVRTVTELFYDLFLAYKSLDIIADRDKLYGRLENAATARYSSGMGNLQEVVMAQTEKYMLRETESMQRQKIASVEAMLAGALGRTEKSSLGLPVEPGLKSLPMAVDQAIAYATAHSPVIAGKERMAAAAEAKIAMAEKEYYPDVTVAGTVADKGSSDFKDMWSITTTINIPLYYQTRQREGVSEARAQLLEAQHDLAGAKLMLASTIRDNYAMAENADRLMELYKDGLLPRAYQDCELALTGYASGKTEAYTVITRMRNLVDYEQAYWERFVERGKAVARIESLLGSATTTEEPAETGSNQ